MSKHISKGGQVNNESFREDSNAGYFHKCANGRKRKRRILELQDEGVGL